MHLKPALFVKDEAKYIPADAEQVLEGARQIIDARTRRGASFSDPGLARDYFRDKLGHQEREIFAAAMLDSRHRLIEYVELFMGTIDGAEVHPREVAKTALRLNAAAMVIAHNHPSGDVEPSAADRAVTSRLKQALALFDIRLLDHVIVGGCHSKSMASAGMI